jgi:hypothetical protein
MMPKTTPTPIPAEAAGERRDLWADGVEARAVAEAEAEAEAEVEEVEVEVETSTALLDATEAECVAVEMGDVSGVEMVAGEFDREEEGVVAGGADGMVVDKLRVVGEIAEAKEEVGEDTGKTLVLVASFCSIDVRVARAPGAGAAQVSLVAAEQ